MAERCIVSIPGPTEMVVAPGLAPNPLILSLRLEAQCLVAFVTNGAAVFRQGVRPFAVGDSAHDAILSIAGRAVTAGSSAHLALDELLPGAVVEVLEASPPRCMRLQLEPALDELDWETFSISGLPLGMKFAISRHLLDEAGGDVEFQASTSDSAHIDVRRIDPRAASLTEAEIAGSDVLDTGGHPDIAAWLESRASGAGTLPRWIAVPAVEPVAARRLVCAGQRRGVAVLVYPAAPVAPGRVVDAVQAVCRCWTQGGSLAEAVQKARTEGSAPPTTRLYGDAWRVPPHPGAAVELEDSLRQVTALSFDLVESTGLLRRVGGERYSQLLMDFHACCTAAISQFGGISDDPQGDDGVMSYFGFPQAAEGAARQAVCAGFKMIEGVARLGLQIRVGIATGQVAVRAGQPVGLAVHLAARLQSAAQANTVLISAATRALVQAEVELEQVDTGVKFKGIGEAQTVYRALALLRNEPSAGIEHVSGMTPFVGRDAELEALGCAWKLARGGTGQVILVAGEAGIGKTRLLREFRVQLRAQGHGVVECRCTAGASASAFHALVMSLRALLRVQVHDDAETVVQKIAFGIPPLIARNDPDAATVVSALLSPAPDQQASALALRSEQLRERTLAVLIAWFVAAARDAPVCLVVDDAHWIDPSTGEFLRRLTDQAPSLPLLVLVASRDDAQVPWHPQCAHETMQLRGLTPADSVSLIRRSCVGAPLPELVIQRLAQRGDGVPLFLEESARMAMETGLDSASELHAWSASVPSTIHDLLMARLDRLGAVKSIAQRCAVLGREFAGTLVDALLAREGASIQVGLAQGALQALVNSGLLLRLGSGADLQYRFKHALVRDTAYLSLWERDRKELHGQVALVLQTAFAELVRQRPELLAHHLSQAGDDAQAIEAWESAARLAATRSAHQEAIDLARRALISIEQVPASAWRDRHELRLQLLLASRYIATEGYGAHQVEAAYLRAQALCDSLGDDAARLKVDLGLEGYYFMRADFARAMTIARRAVDTTRESTDLLRALQAEWAMANLLFHKGDLVPAIQRMDRCLARYHPGLHHAAAVQDPAVMCLCYSAWGQWEHGDAADAARRIQRALALAQELDHPFSLGEAYGFAASVHHFRGEHEVAWGFAEKAVTLCEEGGFSVWLAHARMMRGRVLVDRGDIDGGLAEMDRGYALWAKTGAVVTCATYLAMRAEGLLHAGRPVAATELLAEALRIAQGHGERYYEAEILRLHGEARLQCAPAGDAQAAAEARQWFERAHQVARQQQRFAFALRSAYALALLHRAQGRFAEAAALLEPALAAMPDADHTRDWMLAGQMLAALPRASLPP